MQNAPVPALVIAARRRELREDIERLRAELETLEARDAEYETAERVLASIGGGAVKTETVTGVEDEQPVPATVPDMIATVVQEAYAASRRGVTAGEIFATIQQRWKPDAKSDGVRPVIWRLTKAGRIKKKGKFYYPKADPAGESPTPTMLNGSRG
ncbi:MAG: hypothetical protein P4L72_03900 [Parvibaculum sp.]|uniref:hypothetical protein n=1 Tax=Parvibaculum sp. TaxID=2024848 RepID=UPI00284F08C1|nr:hypothetical protein [Parvibaculum sp.]MDR3498351.1 hypothetical protein [Parvibaculum sp.]